MSVVIGIDGGATKTACVALLHPKHAGDDVPGKVVGQGTAASSNKNSVGQEKAEAAVSEAVDHALAEAGKTRGDVACIVLGMSGCDTDEDVAYWKGICAKMLPDAKAVVENDAVVALCSGTGGELYGVVVISGTGSIGMAIDGDKRVRAGGMGPVLGDAGNAYSIGCAALAAVTRGEDGRGPETPLTGIMLEHLGLKVTEDLLGWAYGDEATKGSGGWDRIAGLAPLVGRGASAGCSVCDNILKRAGHDICELAEAAAKRSGMASAPGGFPLVLTGGVNAGGGVLAKAVDERLAKTLPMARVVRPLGVSSAFAAAQLAQKL